MLDAFVLAGDVSKGAFGAGVLSVLLDPERNPVARPVRCVVATSSGALNGAYLASAIHQGKTAIAGDALCDIWIEHASVWEAFSPSFQGVVSLEGFSSNRKLMEVLRRHIPPAHGTGEVDLKILVTTVAGEVLPGEEATTFEHALGFSGSDFERAERLEDVFEGVAASCAIPFLYTPTAVRMNGTRVPSYDGGLTNNAPIGHALEISDVTRVFVVSPYPRIFKSSSGHSEIGHLLEILLNERLYRDVREARAVNVAMERLSSLLTGTSLLEVLKAIGWGGRRPVEVIEIRPPSALEGGAFDGLFQSRLREAYVNAGQEAARAWIRSVP